MKQNGLNPRRAAAHLAIQAAIEHEPGITHIIVAYETDDDGGWTCVLSEGDEPSDELVGALMHHLAVRASELERTGRS